MCHLFALPLMALEPLQREFRTPSQVSGRKWTSPPSPRRLHGSRVRPQALCAAARRRLPHLRCSARCDDRGLREFGSYRLTLAQVIYSAGARWRARWSLEPPLVIRSNLAGRRTSSGGVQKASDSPFDSLIHSSIVPRHRNPSHRSHSPTHTPLAP